MRDTLVVVFIAETDPDNVYQVCLKAVVNNGVLSTLGCYCRSSNDSLKLGFRSTLLSFMNIFNVTFKCEL